MESNQSPNNELDDDLNEKERLLDLDQKASELLPHRVTLNSKTYEWVNGMYFCKVADKNAG